MYWIGLGTGVDALNSHVVPMSQVALKTGFTVVNIVVLIAICSAVACDGMRLDSDVTKAWSIYRDSYIKTTSIPHDCNRDCTCCMSTYCLYQTGFHH